MIKSETLKRKLNKEIISVQTAFTLHVKEHNCTLDSSNCTERAKYQEKLCTINFILMELGCRGINKENLTCIDSYISL